MCFKIIRTCLLSLAFLGFVTTSLANDLTIINRTNHDSTSIINNGPCSVIFDNGITRAHSTNIVPEKIILKACIFNKTNCKAAVFMNDHCAGDAVATVVFDVKSGIKNIDPSPSPQGYVITGNGFTAFLNGGVTFKPWIRYFYSKFQVN